VGQGAKDELSRCLRDVEIDEAGVGFCEITRVEGIEGEAVANNRKGKLIFFYEWVIKCIWTGRLNGSDEQVKGNIQIPNLSEENSADEVVIDVEVDSNDFNSEILKEVMRNKGSQVIREQISKYITSLRDEFAKDMIKPSKVIPGGSINSFTTEGQSNKDKTGFNQTDKVTDSRYNGAVSKPLGVKIETTSLKLNETFKCTADEFYRALTELELVQAFTRSPAAIDLSVNGVFQLFDGNISGKFTQIEPNKSIKQNWRFKAWPPEHYSEVSIDLEQKEDCTQVTVTQTGIPKTDFERTEEGWKRYYFESMKRTFGFGAILS